MAHSDKKKKLLEILELDGFESVSLGRLQDAVSQKFPIWMTKRRVLEIYVMWLHDRLMAVDISAEDVVADEIGAWYKFVKACVDNDSIIAEALRDWLRAQVVDDPASSRRLSVIESELRNLMPASLPRPESSPDTVKSEDRYGQMHPDRLKLSQASRSETEVDGEEPGIIAEDGAQPGTGGPNGQPDLSFLTGSNRLVLDYLANFPLDKKQFEATPADDETISSRLQKQRRAAKPSGARVKNSKDEAAGGPKKPPKNYRCNRCRRPGHFLQECPTSLDPAFDRPPPFDYICRICKKFGDHYVTFCPRNRDPASLIQQRRRLAKDNSQTGESRLMEARDDYRVDRWARSQSSRLSPFDELPRGRGRLRSPARSAGGKRQGDDFRPGYKSASRRSISPRDNPSKRKALRSLSPGEAPMRKKKQPLEGDEHPKEDPRKKKVTFADDLVAEITNREEGRLSYYDEYDGNVPEAPFSRSPSSEKMDIDGSVAPVFGTRGETDHAEESQLFQDELAEMIKSESTKEDLILLINGIERLPICHVFVARLFKGREENIWFNDTITTSRASSLNFIDLPVEDEEEGPDSIDGEKPAAKEAATEQEEICEGGVEQGGSGSALMVVEPSHHADHAEDVGRDEDAIMADSEPAMAAGNSAEEITNVMLATGNLQIDESAVSETHPERTWARPNPNSFDDESLPKSAAHEAETASATQNPAGVTEGILSSIGRFASDALVEPDGTLPPQSAEGSAMEVELELGASRTADDGKFVT
ncbi:hypothetical protein VTK56DRAFT_242 [Thermocarpiscus australiensis]